MPRKNPDAAPHGVTRRDFLTSMGAGAIGVAAPDNLFAAGGEAAEPQVMPAGQTSKVSLRINGATHVVLAEPRWTLLYVLREVIGLTGAKPGCERGECGACTVLIDGVPRYACLTLAVEAQGREVTTLEGLMDGEALGPCRRPLRRPMPSSAATALRVRSWPWKACCGPTPIRPPRRSARERAATSAAAGPTNTFSKPPARGRT